VNDLLGPGQVSGHTEEASRQILDGHRSEVLGEEPVHPAARRQRDQRERRADDASAASEGGDGPLDPLGIGKALGAQRTHDRSDAGPAHDVDGHAGLFQRPQRAEVSELNQADDPGWIRTAGRTRGVP
jgi:hypothetical protein